MTQHALSSAESHKHSLTCQLQLVTYLLLVFNNLWRVSWIKFNTRTYIYSQGENVCLLKWGSCEEHKNTVTSSLHLFPFLCVKFLLCARFLLRHLFFDALDWLQAVPPALQTSTSCSFYWHSFSNVNTTDKSHFSVFSLNETETK